jgi:hypothetical protein
MPGNIAKAWLKYLQKDEWRSLTAVRTPYKSRVIETEIRQGLAAAGAVVIEGPKACGKTATAATLAASAVLLDVDEQARRAADESRIRVVAAAVAVADAAEDAWQAIEWRRDLALDSAAEELSLGVRKGTPADIAQAKRWLDTIPRDPDGQWSDPKAVYARETLTLADYPDTLPVTLQVHRVGDLSIAAIPCEVFVETGLHLKQIAPFAQHFTVSLANGYNGYLPRAAAK